MYNGLPIKKEGAMKLVPWKKRTGSQMNSLLDDDFWGLSLFPDWDNSLLNFSGPFAAIDVQEDKDRYIVKADLPGMDKKDISLNFERGVLTISGERRSQQENKDKGFHRIERSYGRFSRSVHLGNTVSDQGIKANYKDGVLEVTVLKSKESVGRLIDID